MSDWAPQLVQHIERLRGEACHTDFRLFLAVEEAAPRPSGALLQGATVICWEPPQVQTAHVQPSAVLLRLRSRPSGSELTHAGQVHCWTCPMRKTLYLTELEHLAQLPHSAWPGQWLLLALQDAKEDLRRAFTLTDHSWVAKSTSPPSAMRLCFGLALFHVLLREQRRLGTLHTPNDFCAADLRSAAACLRRAFESPGEVMNPCLLTPSRIPLWDTCSCILSKA